MQENKNIWTIVNIVNKELVLFRDLEVGTIFRLKPFEIDQLELYVPHSTVFTKISSKIARCSLFDFEVDLGTANQLVDASIGSCTTYELEELIRNYNFNGIIVIPRIV